MKCIPYMQIWKPDYSDSLWIHHLTAALEHDQWFKSTYMFLFFLSSPPFMLFAFVFHSFALFKI